MKKKGDYADYLDFMRRMSVPPSAPPMDDADEPTPWTTQSDAGAPAPPPPPPKLTSCAVCNRPIEDDEAFACFPRLDRRTVHLACAAHPSNMGAPTDAAGDDRATPESRRDAKLAAMRRHLCAERRKLRREVAQHVCPEGVFTGRPLDGLRRVLNLSMWVEPAVVSEHASTLSLKTLIEDAQFSLAEVRVIPGERFASLRDLVDGGLDANMMKHASFQDLVALYAIGDTTRIGEDEDHLIDITLLERAREDGGISLNPANLLNRHMYPHVSWADFVIIGLTWPAMERRGLIGTVAAHQSPAWMVIHCTLQTLEDWRCVGLCRSRDARYLGFTVTTKPPKTPPLPPGFHA